MYVLRRNHAIANYILSHHVTTSYLSRALKFYTKEKANEYKHSEPHFIVMSEEEAIDLDTVCEVMEDV